MARVAAYLDKSLELLRRVRETQLESIKRGRLVVECAKLDPRQEQMLAEEGMGGELVASLEY